MRGLKYPPLILPDVRLLVASLADAWIKIKAVLDNMPDAVQSHPSRMRGLK